MENAKLVHINAQIGVIAGAEKITKKVLGELSREMLDYVVTDEAWDSDAINRLLAVLTPMNRDTARLYFDSFTPFVLGEDGTFGGMPKDKKAKAKAKQDSQNSVNLFLVDEDNNIWTWAKDNVKIEKKEIDWAKRVTSAVSSAMDDDKGGLGLPDVLEAVLSAGITADELTSAMAILYAEDAEQDAVEEEKEAA